MPVKNDTNASSGRPVFTRLVILRNPNSTRARDELGLVAALCEQVDVDAHELIMDKEGTDWLETARKRRLLGPDTLLAVIAGDGTMNTVVSRLLMTPKLRQDERRTVILPLWGGNANDLARMLNGMPSRARLLEVLRRGRVVEVHPIEFELKPAHGTSRTRLAVCYASFGASAAVARAINASSFRRITLKTWPPVRLIRELALVIRTLSRAPRFRISDGPSGKPRRIFERVFINGSRLAKVERVSLKLTDKHFYQTSVSRMRLGALFSRALELSDRRFTHKVAETDSVFTVRGRVLAQFDGEDVAVRSGTTVTARVHERPFRALSLRLR